LTAAGPAAPRQTRQTRSRNWPRSRHSGSWIRERAIGTRLRSEREQQSERASDGHQSPCGGCAPRPREQRSSRRAERGQTPDAGPDGILSMMIFRRYRNWMSQLGRGHGRALAAALNSFREIGPRGASGPQCAPNQGVERRRRSRSGPFQRTIPACAASRTSTPKGNPYSA